MKILVHLHLYYHDQTDYFVEKLYNIEGCDWDLVVTYVEENQASFDRISALKSDTKFIKVKNIGYDLWPFIQVIRSVNLNDYDYVIKLHTKNKTHDDYRINDCIASFSEYLWRDELVDSILANKKHFKNILKCLNKDKNIGLVTSKLLYIPQKKIFYENTQPLELLKERLRIKSDVSYLIDGRMFMIKSNSLELIKNSDINENDFADIFLGYRVGTTAYAIEEIFTAITDFKGFKTHLVITKTYVKSLLTFILRNFVRKFFYLRNTDDSFKILTFLGINFSFRKNTIFPKNAINCQKIFTPAEEVLYTTKRAAICATFNKNGTFPDNTIKYFKAIKKHVDYIIVVSDNPIIKNEVEKIKDFADVVMFQRHEEYDFGSYKRGYLKLKELGVLEKIENLLFFNDSVIFEGENLDDVFKKAENKDFYGILSNNKGIWVKDKYLCNVHIQSWFMIISDKIFRTDWFDNFMKNIIKQRFKNEIIAKYEMGFSKIITDNGFKMNTYYPPYYNCINPDIIYANPDNNFEGRLFSKKRFLGHKK